MNTIYELDVWQTRKINDQGKTVHFLFLLALGLLVYFVGGYWTYLSGLWKPTIKLVVPIFLLCMTFLSVRPGAMHQWYRLFLSLLAASTGFLVAWLSADQVLGLMGISPNSIAGIALTKTVDALLITVPVLVVAWVGGLRTQDLYLGRGLVGWWLAIGGIGFGCFATVFYVQTRQSGISTNELLSLLPWTLLFIFANALMEEIHFRGLLLRPFGEALGPKIANLCIAIVFTLIHAPVKYTADILPFLATVFLLSLLWGTLIQKTKSIWGAVLIHAGADLLIIGGIYQMFLS